MTGNHDGNELVRRTRLLAHAVSRRDLLRALAAAGAGVALTSAVRPTSVGAGGFAGVSRGRTRFQDTPVMGGTLTAAITGQPDNMDPHKAGIYASLQIYDNIYSKLIYINQDLTFSPGLAVSWTNTSPTEWEFELVQNAVFHNGEKFTAADVKYTFDRLKDPATASPAATLFAPVTTVEPIDDYHVKFTLEEPFGPFLSHLAGSGQIVNEKAVLAADPARNPVGTGPFKFVEWVTDDHLTLERWDQHYKEGKPYLDRVIFRGMGVDESRMAALQSGEVNWIDAVPLQKVPEVRDGGEFNYYTAATAGLPDYVAMNTTKPPFDNVKLRQAVAWAIDRNAINFARLLRGRRNCQRGGRQRQCLAFGFDDLQRRARRREGEGAAGGIGVRCRSEDHLSRVAAVSGTPPYRRDRQGEPGGDRAQHGDRAAGGDGLGDQLPRQELRDHLGLLE